MSLKETSFCSNFSEYLATLNISEPMDMNYVEPAECLLNEVVRIHNSCLDAPNTLQLNFTCMLNLHTTYNGSLHLIIDDNKGELQLGNEEYESLIKFGE